jgi:CRP/FNR family cyclic AMP-dependent transcriptional regulator
MKERFEGGQNTPRLVETLKEQRIVAADSQLATALAEVGELLEVPAGNKLIEQDAEDTDTYLIVAGTFQILVNGQVVGARGPGNHVGEMAAIQPTQKRSATVQASETSVVLKITATQLATLGERFPGIWRAIAKELARRLLERNRFVSQTHDRIRVFIISSTEALEIARTIQSDFQHDPFTVTIWSHGVFLASQYPVESLEHQLDSSDFAIAIATPDDMLTSRAKTTASPRDNVIFELGLFIGRLGRRRSFLVEPRGEEVKLPSDLFGITTLPYRYTGVSDLAAALGPACTCIRNLIRELGANN